MNIKSIISEYDNFKEQSLTNRFFKHDDIMCLLEKLPSSFEITCLGRSVKDREINLVKWGNGKTKIMLWSQMHGDEATGTMALFDLFNFLEVESELVKTLAQQCQLFILPMVNPDGAEYFSRRNAQQIDINRDFLRTVTPEGKILKQCRANINPDFGFNLHDQNTLWSVTGSLKPATMSFLAPAFDEQLNINGTRKNAMLVIADIFSELKEVLPEQMGLFDDEFEPRAFGDNFQKAGTATILIEAGGFADDYEKQMIRKYYFGAILSGLTSIAQKTYERQNVENYFSIPKNNKQIFHILIHNLIVDGIEVSVGLNYEETVESTVLKSTKTFTIEDIGDLSFCNAYQNYASTNFSIKGDIVFDQKAHFELLENGTVILSFHNGILQ